MSAEPRFPHSTGDATQGSSKPRLTLVKGDGNGAPRPARRPLSRARYVRAYDNRWRVFFGLGALLFSLIVVLSLSITMASRQYELVDLRAQEQALIQSNEALAQEIEFHQAPQDLAIRASQLGLVAASSQATIDLNTGEISGIPMAVTGEDPATKNLISPPALADTKAYEEASARAEEQRKKEEAEAKAKQEAEAKASSDPSAPAPQPSQSGQ
ncbi:hypothetical protein [Rothia nasimurium]|uniref:hypothetical protein n=1 Tax=Rothia nasimurium TaxID=85336 RepID=UPI003B9FA8DE